MNDSSYVGSELELFEQAKNWKRYVFDNVKPFLGCDILEVGAGFGGSTQVFVKYQADRWVCLEPDPQMARQLSERIEQGVLPSHCEVVEGTLSDIPEEERFDTLLYLDVLEHIENDAAEFRLAAKCLRAGGHLVILCPAHNWLYAPFDKAIGHFRRYDKSMMRALAAEGLRPVRLDYLDSVGLAASLANRMVLKQSMPTKGQINTWDGYMVPLSRWLDRVLFHSAGKSILGVWQRV